MNKDGLSSKMIKFKQNTAHSVYEIFEAVPVTEIKLNPGYEFYGRYYVPLSIIYNKGLLDELLDILNPHKCEGASYIVNMKGRYGTDYIEVIFIYHWG